MIHRGTKRVAHTNRVLNRRSVSLAVLALTLALSASWAQKPYRGAEYRTLQAMTYGRFEVRLRTAAVSGMLGSFFTYYDPGSPWNEIDIENMGRYNNESQFNTIVPANGANHVQRQVLKFNPHAAFHVYAIDWTPQYVAWQIDGSEVYRQTGAHITQLTQAQKLMMNIWQPSDAGWAGTFEPTKLPVYVYYDWVKYYAYTPGTNDNFTLQWTDDFNTFDATRWQKATHSWDGNNAQFVQENAAFKDGYLILCLTSNTTSGYGGAAVADVDVDPPYVVSAALYADSTIVVRFSEPLEKASAEAAGNYTGGGFTMKGATLLPDQRTVRLSVSGQFPPSAFPLIVQQVKDAATPVHAMTFQAVNVVMPVIFPVRIDVGGPSSDTYRGDSAWTPAKAYGAVGGVVSRLADTIQIAGTTEMPVYRTSLHGISDYKVRVPNGTYKVTLMMVEDRYRAAGKRLFSAKAEGQTIFTDLDIYQRAGALRAFTMVAPAVQVIDNVMDLWFGASADSTTLSGLQIERLADPSGVLEEGSLRPVDFSLSIYPNPFNAAARLRYALPQAEALTLTLHDLLGREVERKSLGVMAAGPHEYALEVPQLASGVYICRLAGEGGSAVRKVLLMR